MNWTRWNRLRYTVASYFYDAVVRIFRLGRSRAWALVNPQPGESVLLLGAGTGLDLEFVARCHISAIDITPAMLARLKTRAAALDIPVDVRVMDGQALEFPDASFDVVALHMILAVIPDPLACMREVRRVLKPTGRVSIFDKFLPPGLKITLPLRLMNAITRFLATDITRSLEPMLAAADLKTEVDQRRGPWGFLRLVRAVPNGGSI